MIKVPVREQRWPLPHNIRVFTKMQVLSTTILTTSLSLKCMCQRFFVFFLLKSNRWCSQISQDLSSIPVKKEHIQKKRKNKKENTGGETGTEEHHGSSNWVMKWSEHFLPGGVFRAEDLPEGRNSMSLTRDELEDCRPAKDIIQSLMSEGTGFNSSFLWWKISCHKSFHLPALNT